MHRYDKCVFFRDCYLVDNFYRFIVVFLKEDIPKSKSFLAGKYVKRFLGVPQFKKRVGRASRSYTYAGRNYDTLEDNFKFYLRRLGAWQTGQTLNEFLESDQVLLIPPGKHVFNKSIKIGLRKK